MGEIMLAGTTHYPLLLYPDEFMSAQMERHWKSDLVPPEWKDQKNWPAQMQEEYGVDGVNAPASAAAHRKRLVDGFRKVREEIEAFKPDFVLIWGDDQYENFHEDLVPPFSVYLCEEYETQPFHKRRFTADGDEISNVWGEDFDHVFKHAGHPEAAKLLATRLLQMGYPMPYAYKTLHYQGLPHAFLNTLLFLDYDRKGFDYPVIPFHVNCYGSSFVKNKGGARCRRQKTRSPTRPPPRRNSASTLEPPRRGPSRTVSTELCSWGRPVGPTPSSFPSTTSFTLTWRPTSHAMKSCATGRSTSGRTFRWTPLKTLGSTSF